MINTNNIRHYLLCLQQTVFSRIRFWFNTASISIEAFFMPATKALHYYP